MSGAEKLDRILEMSARTEERLENFIKNTDARITSLALSTDTQLAELRKKLQPLVDERQQRIGGKDLFWGGVGAIVVILEIVQILKSWR